MFYIRSEKKDLQRMKMDSSYRRSSLNFNEMSGEDLGEQVLYLNWKGLRKVPVSDNFVNDFFYLYLCWNYYCEIYIALNIWNKEWTKWNLWNTAYKKFEVTWSVETWSVWRVHFTNFAWSIVKYFGSFYLYHRIRTSQN